MQRRLAPAHTGLDARHRSAKAFRPPSGAPLVGRAAARIAGIPGVVAWVFVAMARAARRMVDTSPA